MSYSEGSPVLGVPLPPICACATMSGTAGICHSYSESPPPPPPRLTSPHLSCFAVLSVHTSPTPSDVLSVPLWLGYIFPLPWLRYISPLPIDHNIECIIHKIVVFIPILETKCLNDFLPNHIGLVKKKN